MRLVPALILFSLLPSFLWIIFELMVVGWLAGSHELISRKTTTLFCEESCCGEGRVRRLTHFLLDQSSAENHIKTMSRPVILYSRCMRKFITTFNLTRGKRRWGREAVDKMQTFVALIASLPREWGQLVSQPAIRPKSNSRWKNRWEKLTHANRNLNSKINQINKLKIK